MTSNYLFKQIVGPKEVRGASSHDEGTPVDVDHDGPLLFVDLGCVDVQVQAILVTHGLAGADVELWADVAVVGSVKVLTVLLNFNWGLEGKINNCFSPEMC